MMNTTVSGEIDQHYLITEFKTKNATNCMSSFYTNKKNWFDSISTEILVPSRCVIQGEKHSYFEYDRANETSEISILVIITVTFVMLLLISVTYRSTNPYVADWFRFITLYAAATLLFVFVLQLAPSTPGFSRFVGFSVVIHNFAELYLLRMIWFGKRSSSFIGIGLAVLYVFLMLTFLAFMPMDALYLLALIQGATMDYLFCITFPMVAHKFKPYAWNHCDWVLAAVGAFIHIASIQPLFFGFALGNAQITGITALGLFPTFFFYTYFAGRELGRLGLVGPSYSQLLTYFWSTTLLKKVADVEAELSGGGIVPIRLAVAPTTNVKSTEAEIAMADVQSTGSGSGGNMAAAAESEIMLLSTVDDFNARKEDLQRAQELAEVGVYKYFKMATWQITIIFIAAFLLSLANSLIVWYSPCYTTARCKG